MGVERLDLMLGEEVGLTIVNIAEQGLARLLVRIIHQLTKNSGESANSALHEVQ